MGIEYIYFLAIKNIHGDQMNQILIFKCAWLKIMSTTFDLEARFL